MNIRESLQIIIEHEPVSEYDWPPAGLYVEDSIPIKFITVLDSNFTHRITKKKTRIKDEIF